MAKQIDVAEASTLQDVCTYPNKPTKRRDCVPETATQGSKDLHPVPTSVYLSNHKEFCIHHFDDFTFSSSTLCTGELDNGPSESTAPVQLLHTSFITLQDKAKLINYS